MRLTAYCRQQAFLWPFFSLRRDLGRYFSRYASCFALMAPRLFLEKGKQKLCFADTPNVSTNITMFFATLHREIFCILFKLMYFVNCCLSVSIIRLLPQTIKLKFLSHVRNSILSATKTSICIHVCSVCWFLHPEAVNLICIIFTFPFCQKHAAYSEP